MSNLWAKKMILAFNTYDWLTTSTKCLSRMDEATYTFTLLLVFIIFYYKSLHDGSFQKYASLEYHSITLLSHYSIHPWLTPFYIECSPLKSSHTYIFITSTNPTIRVQWPTLPPLEVVKCDQRFVQMCSNHVRVNVRSLEIRWSRLMDKIRSHQAP